MPQAPVVAEPEAPDEPVQRLAWEAARRIHSGLPQQVSFRLEPIANRAKLPEKLVEYFRSALEKQLDAAHVSLSDSSDVALSGQLLLRDTELAFAFAASGNGATLLSDSSSIPYDSRLQNIVAQFQPEPGPETSEPIPSTLMTLEQPPLDLLPCKDGLILLYPDHLELRDWKEKKDRYFLFSEKFRADTRSRAPSGKILAIQGDFLRRLTLPASSDSDLFFVITASDLSGPIYFDSAWNGPFPVSCHGCPLPVATPGLNTFQIADGHFFDFELLPESRIAVVDSHNQLSLADRGNLITADRPVGSTLCADWPHLYTSAAVDSASNDSLLQFVYQDNALVLESLRDVNGQILNLSLSDLDHDHKQELLAVVKNAGSIRVEVWQP